MKMLRKIFPIVALFWMLAVFFFYFFNIRTNSLDCNLKKFCLKTKSQTYQIVVNEKHEYFFKAIKTSYLKIDVEDGQRIKINPIYGILASICLIYTVFYFVNKIVKGEKIIKYEVSAFFLFLLLSLVFWITYTQWKLYFGVDVDAKYGSLMPRYLIYCLEAFFILLATLSLGRKINGVVLNQEKNTPIENTALPLAFGISALALLLYFLGLFEILKSRYVWVLFGLIYLICIKEVFFWISQFFSNKIKIRLGYFSPIIFLSMVFLFFAGHNLLDLTRPYPIGFDDLNRYMVTVKLLSTEGKLLGGIFSYPLELFLSLGPILFNSMIVSYYLSFFIGMATVMLLGYVVWIYCKRRGINSKSALVYSFLSSVVFYTLPMTVFQSSKDQKTDIASFLFTLISLILFWKWQNSFKNKKYLFVSAFFLGMAFEIKHTTLLFLISLSVLLIYHLFRQKIQLKRTVILLLFFLLFFILPIMPYTVRNSWQTKSLSPVQLLYGKPDWTGFKADPAIDQSKVDENKVNGLTGYQIEYKRYFGFYKNEYLQYLVLPFSATFNWPVMGTYVNVGFLYLAIVPLVLVLYFLIPKNNKKTRILSELIVLSIIYWLLWARFGSAVIWYGLAGFSLFSILFIETLSLLEGQGYKFIKNVALFLIVLWFSSALFLRSAFLPQYGDTLVDPLSFLYAAGSVNDQEYYDQKYAGTKEIVERLNNEIKQNPQNPPKIIKAGTFIKYFIERNNVTVSDDNTLDGLAGFLADKSSEKAIQRLKNAGFKYIVIDSNLGTVDNSPQQSLRNNFVEVIELFKNNPDTFKKIETGGSILFVEII